MSETQIENASTNGAGKARERWHVSPDVDVYESNDAYVLQLDLPGAAADSLNVQVIGSEIVVRAEQAPIDGNAKAGVAVFERSIRLPADVEADSASAALKEGVLEIRVTKRAAARRVKIPIGLN